MKRLLPLLLLLAGCSYGYDTPDFGHVPRPDDFRRRPALMVPADNPVTPDKVALGAQLFADPALSGDGGMSCATCHQPDRGFADGQPLARGAGGRRLVRHTPTIVNTAYAPNLFWDGRAAGLEDQALRPIISGGEMARHPAVLIDAVAGKPAYVTAFARAFPGSGVSEANIARALAAYQRTIVSGEAPFDRFLAGDSAAITPAAARGFALFTGKAKCAACHSGWLLSDGRFHDIGLTDSDFGRGGITNNKAFDHAFRTPSLREIGRTAPYMHDGSLKTLDAVVAHYSDIKVTRRVGPQRITLSKAEQAELVAFLTTLDSDRPFGPGTASAN